VASAFASGYAQAGVPGAIGAVQALDLTGLTQDTESNLGFPIEQVQLAYPGLGLLALLRQQEPPSGGGHFEAALSAAGLQMVGAAALDLNGDGSPEVLAELPAGGLGSLWLAPGPRGVAGVRAAQFGYGSGGAWPRALAGSAAIRVALPGRRARQGVGGAGERPTGDPLRETT